MYKMVDFVTRTEVSAHNFIFTGDNSPWEIMMDMTQIKKKINVKTFTTQKPCLRKYLPFVPIKNTTYFASLPENVTPLLKSKSLAKRLGFNLYFKLEGKNPTGSFKDRGSAVEVSLAKELDARAIILASTGNMAASCACYAALAKISCFVLVPENVSLSKMAQVLAFKGNIIRIKGDYNSAEQLAYELAKKFNFYLAGDYAFRVEGQKIAAFEILDQLGLQVPDAVVVPIGCGTNIAAYAKGFSEYSQLNLIHKIPKLIGVQAAGASAVVNSFDRCDDSIEKVESPQTIAKAIAVSNPVDGVKALAALKQTQGAAYAVTDEEIMEAQYLMATEEGLFVEPAAAASLAGLIRMHSRENLSGKTLVCVLTGDGLKDPEVILSNSKKLDSLYDKTTILEAFS